MADYIRLIFSRLISSFAGSGKSRVESAITFPSKVFNELILRIARFSLYFVFQ